MKTIDENSQQALAVVGRRCVEIRHKEASKHGVFVALLIVDSNYALALILVIDSSEDDLPAGIGGQWQFF